MRVRIRRFEWLRLASKTRDSQPVIVARGQCDVDCHACVLPPAAGVAGHSRGCVLGHTPGAQLAIDGRAPFPLLELNRSQAVADPFVEVAEHTWGICQPEILLPAREIAAQLCD